MTRLHRPSPTSTTSVTTSRGGVVATGLVLGLLCGALTLASCAHKAVESVATEEDVPVAAQPARVVDTFETTITATGRVAPAPGADWTISAPEAARIAELPKSEGERVQEGDLLVRLEVPSLTSDLAARDSDVAQAAARVETTKANHTRVAGLVTRGISAQRDLEAAQMDQTQAEAALKQAQAAAATAKTLIDRTTVKARFAGLVVKRWHNVGDFVDASATDPILRVIDPGRLEVVASVTVTDLGHLTAGRIARVVNPSNGTIETATVVSTPASVDSSSATSEVRLRFEKPTHLAVGTPVSVEIVAEQRKKVLVIPTVAIVRDGAEIFVMVAGQDDDKAHKTPVTLGMSARDSTEVLTGVKAGDLVIVRGQDGLPDEAAIAVVK